jgi:hypothetical protein
MSKCVLGTEYVIRFALCAMMHYRSADRPFSSYLDLSAAISEDNHWIERGQKHLYDLVSNLEPNID